MPLTKAEITTAVEKIDPYFTAAYDEFKTLNAAPDKATETTNNERFKILFNHCNIILQENGYAAWQDLLVDLWEKNTTPEKITANSYQYDFCVINQILFKTFETSLQKTIPLKNRLEHYAHSLAAFDRIITSMEQKSAPQKTRTTAYQKRLIYVQAIDTFSTKILGNNFNIELPFQLELYIILIKPNFNWTDIRGSTRFAHLLQLSKQLLKQKNGIENWAALLTNIWQNRLLRNTGKIVSFMHLFIGSHLMDADEITTTTTTSPSRVGRAVENTAINSKLLQTLKNTCTTLLNTIAEEATTENPEHSAQAELLTTLAKDCQEINYNTETGYQQILCTTDFLAQPKEEYSERFFGNIYIDRIRYSIPKAGQQEIDKHNDDRFVLVALQPSPWLIHTYKITIATI